MTTPATTPADGMSQQDARFAIDGAIAYGRMGTNEPPAGHWLTEYWHVGRQLAKLGETSAWGNQTPVDTPADGELLCCPFCGGPVELERATEQYSEIHGRRQFWGVVCRNTLNRGGTCAIHQIPSASKEAAIERWNRRATPSPGKADAERWIPVMESSPMQGEAVLVAVEFDGPGDWRIKCGGFTEDRTWKVFGASWTPSHWMPMPAAPGAIHRERDKQ